MVKASADLCWTRVFDNNLICRLETSMLALSQNQSRKNNFPVELGKSKNLITTLTL